MARDRKHESYGIISFGKTQGGSRSLFGSSITHSETIRLSIKQGIYERNNNSDHYYSVNSSDGNLLEVEMTLSQFAQAISSMNESGVPVTIRSVAGKPRTPIPEISKGTQFISEFKESVAGISNSLQTSKEKISGLLEKKSLSKADKEVVLGLLDDMERKISKDLPFVEACFQEEMEKTVESAKLDIDSFASRKLGTDATTLIDP